MSHTCLRKDDFRPVDPTADMRNKTTCICGNIGYSQYGLQDKLEVLFKTKFNGVVTMQREVGRKSKFDHIQFMVRFGVNPKCKDGSRRYYIPSIIKAMASLASTSKRDGVLPSFSVLVLKACVRYSKSEQDMAAYCQKVDTRVPWSHPLSNNFCKGKQEKFQEVPEHVSGDPDKDNVLLAHAQAQMVEASNRYWKLQQDLASLPQSGSQTHSLRKIVASFALKVINKDAFKT